MSSEKSSNMVSEKDLTILLNDPDNIYKWIQAIKTVESANDGISKRSAPEEISLLRSLYASFLKRFPYLENYWIFFADLEFRLSSGFDGEVVYLNALKVLPYSLKIWVSFLKYRIQLSNFQYKELKLLFEYAETKIGIHYHSGEFWDLYLEFEKNYNPSEKNEKFERFLILRKVIEQPIHQYAKFYEQFSNFWENEIDLSNVVVFVKESEWPKVGITSPEKLSDMAASNNKQDIDAMLKEIRVNFKKLFTDLYITNQYEVFKIYQYEAKLKRQYFHVTLLTEQELSAWDAYLTYLEIKLVSLGDSNDQNNNNSYKNSIYKNLVARIRLTYERCLISTALYDRFWIRYFWFLVNLKQYSDARNVLIKSCNFLPVTNVSTKQLLVVFENFNGKHFNARDLTLSLLTKFPESPEIWKTFLDSESLFFSNGNDGDNDIIDEKESSGDNKEKKSKDNDEKPNYLVELVDQKLESLHKKFEKAINNQAADNVDEAGRPKTSTDADVQKDVEMMNGDAKPNEPTRQSSEKEESSEEEKELLKFSVLFRFVLSYDSIPLSQKLKLFTKYETSAYRASETYWVSVLKLLIFNRASFFHEIENQSQDQDQSQPSKQQQQEIEGKEEEEAKQDNENSLPLLALEGLTTISTNNNNNKNTVPLGFKPLKLIFDIALQNLKEFKKSTDTIVKIYEQYILDLYEHEKQIGTKTKKENEKGEGEVKEENKEYLLKEKDGTPRTDPIDELFELHLNNYDSTAYW